MIEMFSSLRNHAFVNSCFRWLSRTIPKLLSFSTWPTTRRGRPFPARRRCWAIASSGCCGTGRASRSPRRRRPPRRRCRSRRPPSPCTAAWPRCVLPGLGRAAAAGRYSSNLDVFKSLIHRWWTSPWHLVPTSLTKSRWKGALEQRVGASLSSASPGLGRRSLRYVQSGPWSCSQVQLWLVSQERTSKENLCVVPTRFCSFAVMFCAAMVSHFFLVSSTVYME